MSEQEFLDVASNVICLVIGRQLALCDFIFAVLCMIIFTTTHVITCGRRCCKEDTLLDSQSPTETKSESNTVQTPRKRGRPKKSETPVRRAVSKKLFTESDE